MGFQHWKTPIPWLRLVRFLLFLHLVLLLIILIQTLMSTLLRVLNAGRLFQQLSTKHKGIKHHRVLLSLCAIPRSATKTSISDISPPLVPLTYSRHLQRPRVGTLSLRIWRNSGGGESDGASRPIQSGYPDPCLPEHWLLVLKSTRPTWIMKSTWQKRYRRGEGVA